MNASTPDRGREKGVWYVLESGPYNQALVGLSLDEIAAWAVSLGKALARQERGINAFADDLMDERERYLEVRRTTGGMGGRPPKKGHPRVTLGSPQGDGGAVPYRTETEPDLSTEPKPKEPEKPRVGNIGFSIEKIMGGSGGDKYSEIMELVGEDAIANFTADFCADADRPRAIGGYKRTMRIIGTEAFKSELCRFCGAVSAGEDTPNRGGTFNKHYLKPAEEAKTKR